MSELIFTHSELRAIALLSHATSSDKFAPIELQAIHVTVDTTGTLTALATNRFMVACLKIAETEYNKPSETVKFSINGAMAKFILAQKQTKGLFSLWNVKTDPSNWTTATFAGTTFTEHNKPVSEPFEAKLESIILEWQPVTFASAVSLDPAQLVQLSKVAPKANWRVELGNPASNAKSAPIRIAVTEYGYNLTALLQPRNTK